METLIISIVLDTGDAINLVEEMILENRSTVVVKFESLSENNHRFEIKGSKNELLKLQQAFAAIGYNGTIIDS
ncbi:MAG: hypothetical protein NTX82_01970 [Candidatus Parcubacteria bacterium]|nr:hypothetical protein [Candidatus Parcubacteria bacterium]